MSFVKIILLKIFYSQALKHHSMICFHLFRFIFIFFFKILNLKQIFTHVRARSRFKCDHWLWLWNRLGFVCLFVCFLLWAGVRPLPTGSPHNVTTWRERARTCVLILVSDINSDSDLSNYECWINIQGNFVKIHQILHQEHARFTRIKRNKI